MVLHGYELLEDVTEALEALGADRVLTQRRKRLIEDPVMVVARASGVSSVHVLAEEMAFVSPELHDIDLVASDDATTCSIVILTSANIVGVAHIDSPRQMAFYLKKWETLNGSKPSSVAIAGGYDDERGIARPITLDILQSLMYSDTTYTVQQFVTGRWNSRETPNRVAPIARGIGYFPGEDIYRLVEFEADARLPMVPTRFAGVSPHPLHLLMCCVEKETPLVMAVGPYSGTFFFPEACSCLLALTDDELLPRISTSPLCEGPKFLQDMRDMLQFTITCSLQTLGEMQELVLPPR
ncbi:N-terminal asparagine amidase [Phytophthora boehmeriae]|uniref:N-terminal asparagine amidase n=1 Tax=Phytophthora boehmeriae TaxID=109152 RepID=A0A8T1XDN3_9STRA|nr:N-terminal asparagine amidase [Phytophthora boehmeriae]